MKSRIFNIMQYELHPETQEPLIDENIIIKALQHKTISRWAYIAHTEDTYSAKDMEQNPEHEQGKKKPKHWHIAIETKSNAIEVGVIAKWFGIAENFVDIPKGRGAFLDCVEYLTHEAEKQQALGKHRYADEEVKSNFDFRKELQERAEKKLKYGRELNTRDRFRYDVLYNGMTLKQCREADRYNYMDDIEKLKKLRMDYISTLTPPKNRLNYYVCGKGRIGKGLMCRAIARNLFPNVTDDYDIFFEVGAKGAAFEGYDGQPVIIWNDRRAIDLLQELNGRGNVFNVFDVHPSAQKQNIKYGSINLCNKVNLVNSVQPYKEFLDGLAGGYIDKAGEEHTAEDKNQSYGRFPFIIPLHEDDFSMLINYGFLGQGSFTDYLEYNHIRGNMRAIAERLSANEELARQIESKTVKPITEKSQQIIKHLETATTIDTEEINRLFGDYGTRPTDKVNKKTI